VANVNDLVDTFKEEEECLKAMVDDDGALAIAGVQPPPGAPVTPVEPDLAAAAAAEPLPPPASAAAAPRAALATVVDAPPPAVAVAAAPPAASPIPLLA
jgi:hypothetical protein